MWFGSKILSFASVCFGSYDLVVLDIRLIRFGTFELDSVVLIFIVRLDNFGKVLFSFMSYISNIITKLVFSFPI